MKIAISSLDQSWKDKAENRLRCEQHCALAAKQEVNMIVFPEMTLTGFCMDAAALSETIQKADTKAFFAAMARRYDLFILYGYIADKDGFYNRAEVVNPLGVVTSQYDKIHPFVYAGEDKIFNGGERLAVTEIMGVRVGITICYDLRFPELYTSLAPSCDLVINIANWPERRVLHWDTLLRARAIENQYYMLGVNRMGVDGNGISYQKSSKCYHPSGEQLKNYSLDENLDLIDLDMDSLVLFRSDFPTLSSRRESLYATFRQ